MQIALKFQSKIIRHILDGPTIFAIYHGVNTKKNVNFRNQTSKGNQECQPFKQSEQSQIGYIGNHQLQEDLHRNLANT